MLLAVHPIPDCEWVKTHLTKHVLGYLTILHLELVRRVRILNPGAVIIKPDVIPAQAGPPAVSRQQFLKGRRPLDLELDKVAVGSLHLR